MPVFGPGWQVALPGQKLAIVSSCKNLLGQAPAVAIFCPVTIKSSVGIPPVSNHLAHQANEVFKRCCQLMWSDARKHVQHKPQQKASHEATTTAQVPQRNTRGQGALMIATLNTTVISRKQQTRRDKTKTRFGFLGQTSHIKS